MKISNIHEQVDGIAALDDAAKRLNIDLLALIAETAIWANPGVHKWLGERHHTAAFFPMTRRYRSKTEQRREIVKQELLDDNTLANRAIKSAIGRKQSEIKNYTACHVWPGSCYDSQAHTVIANLVLLPSPLAALSDFHPRIVEALKCRSYELFNWLPPHSQPPDRPPDYPTTWRTPEPFSDAVRAKLQRLNLDYLSRLS